MKISSNQKFNTLYFFIFFVLFISINLSNGINSVHADQKKHKQNSNDIKVFRDALTMINKGRETFRYDTFGDESFWGDGIRLHLAIAGKRFGGVGSGLSPKDALALGLKIDVKALPKRLRKAIRRGKIDLNDPATTLALLMPFSRR